MWSHSSFKRDHFYSIGSGSGAGFKGSHLDSLFQPSKLTTAPQQQPTPHPQFRQIFDTSTLVNSDIQGHKLYKTYSVVAYDDANYSCIFLCDLTCQISLRQRNFQYLRMVQIDGTNSLSISNHTS